MFAIIFKSTSALKTGVFLTLIPLKHIFCVEAKCGFQNKISYINRLDTYILVYFAAYCICGHTIANWLTEN